MLDPTFTQADFVAHHQSTLAILIDRALSDIQEQLAHSTLEDLHDSIAGIESELTNVFNLASDIGMVSAAAFSNSLLLEAENISGPR